VCAAKLATVVTVLECLPMMMTSSTSCLAIVAILCFVCVPAVSAVSCLNNEGHAVDWFFTYKLPDGYDIGYVDSNTERTTGPVQQWTYPLNATQSSQIPALIKTLDALSSSRSTAEYFLYNDEPPAKTVSSSFGHAKGVVAISSRSGFWVTHSTPRWPLASGPNQWAFEERETTYGQTFLCVSVSAAAVNTIAGQMLFIKPYVYKSTISAATQAKYANLKALAAGQWHSTAGSSIVELQVGSTTFTHLAKNAKWNSDLYEDLVAPHFGADLLVESWMRGGKLGPYCQPQYKFDVTDVSMMRMETLTGKNTTWKETQDHAKWCVSPAKRGLVCVADENRMTSQRKRGGGALCQFADALYGQLFDSIVTAAQC